MVKQWLQKRQEHLINSNLSQGIGVCQKSSKEQQNTSNYTFSLEKLPSIWFDKKNWLGLCECLWVDFGRFGGVQINTYLTID